MMRKLLQPNFIAIGWLLLLGLAIFSLTQTVPNISDNIGYIYAGERLAAGAGLTYEDSNNRIAGPYFSLYAFQIRQPGDTRLFLGYPPGLPLLLGGFILLTGQPTWAHYLVPLLALLGLALTYWLGTVLTGNRWTALASIMLLSLAPTFWEFSTAAWSEIPSLLFVVAGYLCFLLSRQEERSPRAAVGLSALAGLLLVYSLYIRYANVMFLPALGLFDLAQQRWQLLRPWHSRIFYSIVGLGLGTVLLFNQRYYGGYLTTSYSAAHGWYPQAAFSLQYALTDSFGQGYSLLRMLQTLWRNFPGLILLAPLGWTFWKRPFAILVVAATLAPLALYSIYAFPATGVNARFLIPTFPFISLAILFAIEKLPARWQRPQWAWVPAALILLAMGWHLPATTARLTARNNNAITTVNKVQRIVDGSEADAVFLSYTFNDHIRYYGERSVLNYRRIPPADAGQGRFLLEQLAPCLTASVSILLADGQPVYYVQDNTPSYWNSLDILQNHFKLELVQENPSIYKLSLAGKPDLLATAAPCAAIQPPFK